MKLYAVKNSEQLKIELSRIKIPAFKALNLSKLNQKEYTRLWLARLGSFADYMVLLVDIRSY